MSIEQRIEYMTQQQLWAAHRAAILEDYLESMNQVSADYNPDEETWLEMQAEFEVDREKGGW